MLRDKKAGIKVASTVTATLKKNAEKKKSRRKYTNM